MGLIFKTLLGASIREETSFARKKTVLKGLEQGAKKTVRNEQKSFHGGLLILLGIPRRDSFQGQFPRWRQQLNDPSKTNPKANSKLKPTPRRAAVSSVFQPAELI